jgi:FeS assembly SUF system regulator
MLRLGRLPDYGLVIATFFVDAEGLLTTKDLAQRSQIPLATVRKLLKYLVDAGLIKSFRGNKGGYTLARQAADISVADIIQAIDGPIALTDCSRMNPDHQCSLEASCPLAHKWCEVNKEIVEKLQSISIREITS